MRRTRRRVGVVVAVVLIISVGAVPGAIAGPALPQDECASAPVEVARIVRTGPGEQRTPTLVGDMVWFGDSVYRPDGSLVGPVPSGTLRGEIPPFGDEILLKSDVTWGVVVAGETGTRVYSLSGEEIVELDSDVLFAEAVYDDGHIVVSLFSDYALGENRIVLVSEPGITHELTTNGSGYGQFAAVGTDRVFVVMNDGGLAMFDIDGTALGTSHPQVQFSGVFAANGYVYAYTGPGPGAVGSDTDLWVLDRTGALVNTHAFPGSAVGLGPTDHGVAADISLDFSVDSPRLGHVLSPNGALVAVLDEDVDFTGIVAAHGRYLLGLNVYDYSPGPSPTSKALNLYRNDGVWLGPSEAFQQQSFYPGRPAGKTLLVYGPDRGTIEFRSLSGALISRFDLNSDGPEAAVEASTTDHDHVWVMTEASGERNTAHVYDLGPCAGMARAGTFLDDDLTVFENDIEWLAGQGITRGCNPGEANTKFCPERKVTRGEMAAFLHRAFPDIAQVGAPQTFSDTATSEFASDIAWLSATGITKGCGPTSFCPQAPVTREQMAAFLVRALDLPHASSPDQFDDDNASIFQDDIDRLAAAGITHGCGASLFCPGDPVTRQQMAAFIHRSATR